MINDIYNPTKILTSSSFMTRIFILILGLNEKKNRTPKFKNNYVSEAQQTNMKYISMQAQFFSLNFFKLLGGLALCFLTK